ncbi:MAG: hypothetical protein JWO20_2857 [Candidatus Angelobacter sp.]|jgi:hypothetical protein|nr:hypothetical protein [Candidatus Angelobacter sp.]
MKKITSVGLVFFVCLPVFAVAQAQNPPTPKQTKAASKQAQKTPASNQPEATRTLVINGQAVPGAAVQFNGRTYADIFAFAQLTGASIHVLPDRIVLTMPGAGANAATPEASVPRNPQALSRDFARAAIAHLADIREWRNAIETLVSVGAPESLQVSNWLRQHRSRAEESLRLAGIAASTPADRNALQLLQTEFSFVQQWDSAAAQSRQNLDASYSVDPDSLQNDTLLAKINNCDHFLSDMLSNGTFFDSGACR